LYAGSRQADFRSDLAHPNHKNFQGARQHAGFERTSTLGWNYYRIWILQTDMKCTGKMNASSRQQKRRHEAGKMPAPLDAEITPGKPAKSRV
jgi:hypothetical protein